MLSPGDKVAVVSPSRGLPEVFPAPYELGLTRLRDDFGLTPVEYPTTRRLRTTPQERAADLHAAFADPEVKGSSRRSVATTRSPCSSTSTPA